MLTFTTYIFQLELGLDKSKVQTFKPTEVFPERLWQELVCTSHPWGPDNTSMVMAVAVVCRVRGSSELTRPLFVPLLHAEHKPGSSLSLRTLHIQTHLMLAMH